MSAPWIPPEISAVFDPPLLGDSKSVFDGKAFALVGNLNTWSGQVNAVAAYLQEVAQAAMQAAALANFKGAWDANTGAMTKPASVAWNDELWALLEDLSAVQDHEPSLSSTKWARVREQAERVTYGAGSVADALTAHAQWIAQASQRGLHGFRNLLLNSQFDLGQMGLSFPAATLNTYTLDRWRINGNNAPGVVTVARNADKPADINAPDLSFSLRATVTTAKVTLASNDMLSLGQIIEGFNARSLRGRPTAISFWVRSAKTGVHCVSLRNKGQDRSYILEYTVAAADTWEKKTLSVPGGLITAGTWDWGTDSGLRVDWIIAAGTGYHGAAGAWLTTSAMSTASQVNGVDTVGNIFAIAAPQVEQAAAATDFENRPIDAEILACFRYTEAGVAAHIGVCASGEAFGVPISFKVPKRAQPAVGYHSTSSTVGAASPLLQNVTPFGMTFQVTASATGAASVSTWYTASAELS